MKSNWIFGFLIIAGLTSFSAYAQENGNRDEDGNIVRGAYLTNRGRDNWFISIGGGINSIMGDNVKDLGSLGLAGEVYIGKWFTPSVGVRLGYSGVTGKFVYTDAMSGGEEKSWNHFIHTDLMWNISNSWSGYKETRFWNIIPYIGFGIQDARHRDASGGSNANNLGFAADYGFYNNFRLGNHVSLYLDLGTIMTKPYEFDTHWTLSNIKYAWMPKATIGFVFNLGKTNWTRYTPCPPVPDNSGLIDALKKRVADLEKENAALKDEIEALKNQKPDTVYVGGGEVASSATLYFDIGTTTLSDRELAHLDYYIDNVINNSEDTITVTGCADSATGSVKRNQQLSEQRADYVKNYLVKKGVSEDRINVVVEGPTERFASPALNRVVVIE